MHHLQACPKKSMVLKIPGVMTVWEVSDDKMEIKTDSKTNYNQQIYSGYTALCRNSLRLQAIIFKLSMHLVYRRI